MRKRKVTMSGRGGWCGNVDWPVALVWWERRGKTGKGKEKKGV